jgi:hypothetical protein
MLPDDVKADILAIRCTAAKHGVANDAWFWVRS